MAASADPLPELLPRLSAWMAEAGHHGEVEEMPFLLPNGAAARISTGPDECLGRHCAHYANCWGHLARRRAEQAEIVITNHALLALNIATQGLVLPGKYDVVIIDEAHAFEDAATKGFGFEASSRAVARSVQGRLVHTYGNPDVLDAAKAAASRLGDTVAGLFGRPDPAVQRALLDVLPGATLEAPAFPATRLLLPGPLPAALDLADELERLATSIDPEQRPGTPAWVQLLSPFDSPPDELDRLDGVDAAKARAAGRMRSLSERLRTIGACDDPLLVYIAEQMPGNHDLPGYLLSAQPVDVAPYLGDWWEQQATILTSATLSDGNSLDFVSNRLGLDRPRNLIVPSPFDYAARTRLVVTPVAGHEAGDADYFERLTWQIAKLMDAAAGKSLILFTSYRALDAVWGRLASGLRMAGWQLARQGDAPAHLLYEMLRHGDESRRAALFATRSWWQGVDLPGMRLVVMDKLPFPQLGDPLVAARLSHVEAEGLSSFPQYMLPQALITFRQGFGRLMRNERDFGAVAILDDRVLTRRYGRLFFSALPVGIPVLRSADELRAWIREMGRQPADDEDMPGEP